MSKPIPYMKFYVSDYIGDTMHLSTVEHGAYMLIMCSYWQKQKAPHEDKMHQIARMPKSEWADIRETLAELFKIKDGLWTHKRIDAELKQVKVQAKKNREAGIKSGEARRRKAAQNERPFNARSTNDEQTYEADRVYTVGNASLSSQTAENASKKQNYYPDPETLKQMEWNEGFWTHEKIHSRSNARKWGNR